MVWPLISRRCSNPLEIIVKTIPVRNDLPVTTRFYLASWPTRRRAARPGITLALGSGVRQAAGKILALSLQFLRNNPAQRVEEFRVPLKFHVPLVRIDSEQLVHLLNVYSGEFVQIEIFDSRQEADWRLGRACNSFTALENPFQNAHVVPETRPEKFAISVFTEPIHVKDQRRPGESLTHLEPMREIIANVVAAERQHRHGIAPHLPDCACCGGGRLRSHCRADI